ncbi:protein phosphatase CheZ [Methylopila sp. M107]|uniref:protein phosphatase CheZ n=1 Tax=Methylopila sp. M107 TaxID=1101190 RepID=UPI000382323A|nr:protein phosphatase CheZ [Methylopila sp. M107]
MSEALKVVEELRRFAGEISAMRAEISQLRRCELTTTRLPAAGRQLGEITAATETAANAIMEAVEAMLQADAADAAAYKALVADKSMAIFEACAFQDVTGQLISRVSDTVSQIEQRITRVAEAIESVTLPAMAAEPQSARDRRARELLLNGPQGKADAIAQAEVDALLADFGG